MEHPEVDSCRQGHRRLEFGPDRDSGISELGGSFIGDSKVAAWRSRLCFLPLYSSLCILVTFPDPIGLDVVKQL